VKTEDAGVLEYENTSPSSEHKIVTVLSTVMLPYSNVYVELHKLYSSPNIIRMITPRRMRWAGQ
jgi:hypothetical protein